jgi:hypothetical protein
MAPVLAYPSLRTETAVMMMKELRSLPQIDYKSDVPFHSGYLRTARPSKAGCCVSSGVFLYGWQLAIHLGCPKSRTDEGANRGSYRWNCGLRPPPILKFGEFGLGKTSPYSSLAF